MNPSPMDWRQKITGSGLTLSLLAWSFGALLLGLGNAFIGPVDTEFSGLHGASLSSTALDRESADQHSMGVHTEQPPAFHYADLGSDGTHAHGSAPHQQTAHHEASGPLPAHCLFCLDGLSASAFPPLDIHCAPVFGAANSERFKAPSIGLCFSHLTPPVRAPPPFQFS